MCLPTIPSSYHLYWWVVPILLPLACFRLDHVVYAGQLLCVFWSQIEELPSTSFSPKSFLFRFHEKQKKRKEWSRVGSVVILSRNMAYSRMKEDLWIWTWMPLFQFFFQPNAWKDRMMLFESCLAGIGISVARKEGITRNKYRSVRSRYHICWPTVHPYGGLKQFFQWVTKPWPGKRENKVGERTWPLICPPESSVDDRRVEVGATVS